MDIPMLRFVTLADGTHLRNIDMIRRRVDYAISSTNPSAKFIIIIAGTSSGKTITVPTALYQVRQNIIVTLPTIILVKTTAADVCRYVPGFTLGDNVGVRSSNFRIRNPRGITFATDGVLLMYLTTMPDETIMRMFGIIILDEFHKRSIVLDYVAFLLKMFIRRNCTNPQCPVILFMSATIDPAKYLVYFGLTADSVVSIPTTPAFQKQLVFLDAPSTDYIADACAIIKNLHAQPGTKNILMFLPTTGIIRKMVKGCSSLSREIVELTGVSSRRSNLDTSGTNKLFLATPVAETGLTLTDLTHVIDTGMYLAVEYNPVYDYTILMIKPVTEASAIQRIGRVGRMCDGTAYLLYTRPAYDALVKHTAPNIVTASFAETLLSMLMLDVASTFWDNIYLGVQEYWRFYTRSFKFADIDMIDNPPTDTLHMAIAKLYLVGFYSPYTGLTRLGAIAATLVGVGVYGAKAIFAAYYYRANIYDIVTIVTALELKIDAPKQYNRDDDCIRLVSMFYNALQCVNVAEYNQFLVKHRISDISMQQWIDSRDSVLYALISAGFVLRRGPPLDTIRDLFPAEHAHDVRALRMALYEGYKGNLMQNGTCVRTGSRVIYRGTVAIPPNAFYITHTIVYRECGGAGNKYYKATCSGISLVPDDFAPDTTFCES